MDCLTFICSSVGAARVMKLSYFANEPLVSTMWAKMPRKGRRATCDVKAMIRILGRCTKPEAAVLTSKLVKQTAKDVSGPQPVEDVSKDEVEIVDNANRLAPYNPAINPVTSSIVQSIPVRAVNDMVYNHYVAYNDPSKTQAYAVDLFNMNSNMFATSTERQLQITKYREIDEKEQHQYRQRKRVREEEEDKEAAARVKLEHKMKFCKSIGDQENYKLFMQEYAAL